MVYWKHGSLHGRSTRERNDPWLRVHSSYPLTQLQTREHLKKCITVSSYIKKRTTEKLYGFNKYLSCPWNAQYPLQVATVNFTFNINLMSLFSISFIICCHNYYKSLSFKRWQERWLILTTDRLSGSLFNSKQIRLSLSSSITLFCLVTFQQTRPFNRVL